MKKYILGFIGIVIVLHFGNSISRNMSAQTYKQFEVTFDVTVTIEPCLDLDTLPIPLPIIVSLLADNVEFQKKDTNSIQHVVNSNKIVPDNLIQSVNTNVYPNLSSASLTLTQGVKDFVNFDYWIKDIDSSVSMEFGVVYATGKAGLVTLKKDSTKSVLGFSKIKSNYGTPATIILKRTNLKINTTKLIELDTVYFRIKLPKETKLTNKQGNSLNLKYITPSKEIGVLLKDKNTKIRFGAALEVGANQARGKYKGTVTAIIEYVLPELIIK